MAKKAYTWVVETREHLEAPWRVFAMGTEESSLSPHVFMAAKQLELSDQVELPTDTAKLTLHQW